MWMKYSAAASVSVDVSSGRVLVSTRAQTHQVDACLPADSRVDSTRAVAHFDTHTKVYSLLLAVRSHFPKLPTHTSSFCS